MTDLPRHLPTPPDLPAPSSGSQPWERPLAPGEFPAASLSAWLPLVAAAGVPYVPAETVAEIPVYSLLRFDQPDDPRVANDLLAFDAAVRDPVPGTVLRWDYCTSEGLKHVMAHPGDGDCPAHDRLYFSPDDPRAFDILFETPGTAVRILRRPWIPALMHEGFPVEFRVFADQGTVIAVSNYYVQRPLPENPDILARARQAAVLGQRILDQLGDKRPVNPGRRPGGEHPICVTMDFLVRRNDRETVFLEAGPGYGFGAHPCCFHDERQGDPRRPFVHPLTGIRLSDRGPTLPLRDTPDPSGPT